MPEVVLKASGISRVYGFRKSKRETALKNIDISLEKGHIYGLIGNNGAGKTTFMKIVCGLIRQSGGSISLFSSSNDKEVEKARQKLGVLIDSPTYYDDLTIMQNLKSQAMLFPEGEQADLNELCASVGIDKSLASKTIKKCSLGQKQRYALASALLGKPELLILDEPLNGLDPEGINDFRSILLELNEKQGITMLISSHMLSEMHKTASDYIFFKLGEVLECITAQELDRRIAKADLKDVESYFLQLNRGELKWQS